MRILRVRGLCLGVACLLLAGPARAAFISEIDLSSPAGRAIEFSDLDAATDYTLLIIDANALSPANFGRVRGVVTLPAGIGATEVVMVSDSAWPGDPGRTAPMSALSPPPDPGTLALEFSRLLVLLEGMHSIARFTDLLPDGGEPPLYDADDVSDWLVFGDGAVGPMYQSNGHDIDKINTTLGIGLLTRLVDKNTGSVIGRAMYPGEAIDFDTFFSGEPDALGRFPVGPDFNYVYTPGLLNAPLEAVGVPEDLDGDGDVDDADFGLAFAAFTGPGNGPSNNPGADFDGDSDVDDADFALAFAAFTGPGGLSSLAASGSPSVPEPGVAVVLGLVLLGSRRAMPGGRAICMLSSRPSCK